MGGTRLSKTWTFVLALAALGWAQFCLSSSTKAADFVMKFGTATFNESQHQYIKFYKEALEKASGGRIEVGIIPAASLDRSRA